MHRLVPCQGIGGQSLQSCLVRILGHLRVIHGIEGRLLVHTHNRSRCIELVLLTVEDHLVKSL